MSKTAQIFKAMGEPTRQQIIGLLARRDMGVGEIAGHFSMSRPAVAKHLALMRRCGLLEMSVQGREHIHHLRRDKMHEAGQWIEQFSLFWDEKLADLKQIVESEHE
ncbi:MAG: transcriptional regulator [Robiginitomaculum sp.]|nr:MAG: transcriptional regulator [Robiginitomaculum sp.]